MPTEIMLGIDFGTSYTSAGALVGGKVELVQDHGDAAIPSVVYVPRGGDLVAGSQAASRLASDPGATISSIKRLIGVTPEKLKAVVASTRHQVRIANGRILMATGAGELATEQIAAAILARVRDLGERRFGGKIRRAVIAIPAAATREYVAALQRAAKLAHLEIVQVVSEPIAGALALGLHGDPVSRRLVVCDFGGGTFDVTAVEQGGLKFTPVATYGEEYLGGDDLDIAMTEAIAGSVFGRSRFNILDDLVRRTQLVQRCESAKRTLSTHASARLQMRDAFVEAGQHRTLDLLVERSWIEPIWTPIIARAVACVAKTIMRAGWHIEAVDQIVLIGGSSTVPMYRQALEIAFGAERISSTPLAGIAVAMGTALVTARHISAGGEIPVLAPPSLKPEDDGIPIDIAL